MPNFDWQQRQGVPLVNRFGDWSTGWREWARLVMDLEGLGTNPAPEDCQLIFDTFLRGADGAAAQAPSPRECRVFVSHRGTTRDTAFAERIAFLAVSAGYEYWLDIHDPALSFLNNGPPIQSPAREVLIAAIIEIGLLNASHVIAVLTDQSAGSQWIPYEFGRAKQRLIFASRSATWLEPTLQMKTCGEYIYLAAMNQNENDIDQWLRTTSSPYCAQSASSTWPNANKPAPLP